VIHRATHRRVLPALVLGAGVLAACAGGGASGPSAGAGTAATPAAAAVRDGCPLEPDAVTAATGMTFTLRQTLTDRPLETLETVTADTTCVLTADEVRGAGGDPLVLRADVVSGPAVAELTAHFQRVCTGSGGTLSSSGGTTTCANRGGVQEGLVVEGDRAVEVSYVAVPQDRLAAVTASFDEVLALV